MNGMSVSVMKGFWIIRRPCAHVIALRNRFSVTIDQRILVILGLVPIQHSLKLHNFPMRFLSTFFSIDVVLKEKLLLPRLELLHLASILFLFSAKETIR